MKKNMAKNIIKILVFISFASLPFITSTQILGMDIFLDSFEKPEYYLYLSSSRYSISSTSTDKYFMVIQKSTHPDFSLQNGDKIIYYTDDGKLECYEIKSVNSIGLIKNYRVNKEDDEINQNTIYNTQIIGKIVKIVGDNLFNTISMEIWNACIHNLNIRSILTD